MNRFLLCLLGITLTSLVQAQEEKREPAKTWTLRGRAVDETGKPVAGACLQVGSEVEVTTLGTLATPRARSNADGSFEASVAAPADAHVRRVMLLTAPGRLAAILVENAVSEASPLMDHTIDFGDVPLAPGVTLRGLVRRAGGEAVAGVRVTAMDAIQHLIGDDWSRGGAFYQSIAVTDDKGQFTLPGVASTGARILARAEGCFEEVLPFVSPGEGLVIEVEPSGFVEGEVLDAEGKPADAWVWVRADVGDAMRPYRTAKGKFRITLPRQHRYRVTASLVDGHAEASSETLTGPARDLVLRPARPASPHGSLLLRVTDQATGKAVTDVSAAAVWIDEQGPFEREELQPEFERLVVRGKQSGELRLPGPMKGQPDLGVVIVEAKGYATLMLPEVLWLNDEPVVLEAKLVREAVVTGVVIDEASGKPVAGAVLMLGDLEEDDLGPWHPDVSDADLTPGNRVTDEQGRFRIGRLPAGKQKITALLWPRPESAAVKLQLQEGEVRESVRLLIPRGVSITGRLLGAEPGPFAAVHMRWRPKAEKGWTPSWSAFADHFAAQRAPVGAGGRFRFPGLARGEYELKLIVPHREGRGGWLRWSMEPVHVRRIDLQRDCDISECVPGTIRGKVSVVGTALPPGRLVVALHATGESEHARQRPIVCDPVGDSGFALPAPAGEYRLELLDLATRVPMAVKEHVRVEAGASLEVELAVELVSVRVTLKPEQAGGPVNAESLQVVVKHDGCDEQPIEAAATIQLAPGTTELDVFLPRLPVRLQVHGARFELADGAWRGRESLLVERAIEPQQRSNDRIEIAVPAAPVEARSVPSPRRRRGR